MFVGEFVKLFLSLWTVTAIVWDIYFSVFWKEQSFAAAHLSHVESTENINTINFFSQGSLFSSLLCLGLRSHLENTTQNELYIGLY